MAGEVGGVDPGVHRDGEGSSARRADGEASGRHHVRPFFRRGHRRGRLRDALNEPGRHPGQDQVRVASARAVPFTVSAAAE